MPYPPYPAVPLTEAQRHQVLVEWNEPRPEYCGEGLLPDLVAARAAERPEAVALVAGGERVRYGELDARAGRLAAALRRQGVVPESVVGVLVERSPAMAAALLAVWRCGAAYLPLDPEHPRDRLAFILGDGLRRGPGPRIVIVGPPLAGRIPDPGIEILSPDAEAAGVSGRAPDLLPDHPAYVIYTSGSTGHPKGVVVSHRALANRILWARAAEMGPDDAFLHKTTLAFDVSLPEIFAPLVAGGRCVMAPPGGQRDVAALAGLIAREGVTHASFPPSLLRLLLEIPDAAAKLGGLRVLITGGETVPPDLPARVRAILPGTVLYNRYGPTETTVSVLSGTCEEGPGGAVPMGRPIARARIHVLDGEMRPLLPGAAGEIHVGGVCLARGYLGRPALTAERFVPDPFGAPGERLYRTGDRAHWLPNGTVGFLGRIDQQVKIRGVRVEPGEVEAVLAAAPGVREVAVVACEEEATGSRRLVAFVLPEPGAGIDVPGLRRHLAGRLEESMIPSAFVVLAGLPRTLSGKVDRAALTERARHATAAGGEGEPARTELERALARALQELLRVERVGVDDDFFALGCHSLLLMRLQARLREIAGLDVPLADVVRNPSVRALARFLEAGEPGVEIGPAELAAEAALEPEIRPRPIRPEKILLTGATGFLGSHLLAELLERTPARIVCLVRAVDEEQGRHALRAALERYGLWRGGWEERIVPLPGDLGLPRLGLSQAAWAELADTLDAIYHCGAQVNYAYPYETLRAANVEGTREMLRLAVAGRAKALHHVSSLSVLEGGPRQGPGALPEEPLSPDARGVAGGYRQSKWVAERLVQTAAERGVPAVVYRPGWITGSSRTGAPNGADFLIRLVRGSLQAGVAPEIGAVEVCPTPVDWVAAGIVKLSLDPRSVGGVFHLINPRPVALEGVLELLGDLGHPLRKVPVRRWAEALAELAESGGCAPVEPLASLLRQLGTEARNGESLRLQPFRFASARTQAVLANGSGCPRVDRELLEVYLTSLLPGSPEAPAR